MARKKLNTKQMVVTCRKCGASTCIRIMTKQKKIKCSKCGKEFKLKG